MTPAEHAATVRAVGEWLSQMEGRTVTAADLAAILPDIERGAERATELERERDDWHRLFIEAMEKLVAEGERAEQLERERDHWHGVADGRLTLLQAAETQAKQLEATANLADDAADVAEARAEQLETTNKELRKALEFYAKQDIAVVARAALDGGTATPETREQREAQRGGVGYPDP